MVRHRLDTTRFALKERYNMAPQTFEDLIKIADAFRPKVEALADGIRWCWIAEWRSEIAMYKFGVKIEGQTLWLPLGLLARANYEWIGRLNQRDGISSEAHTSIWNSGQQEARACLSEDEAEVAILLRGIAPQFDQETGRYVFSLESDKANDLFSSLCSILEKLNAMPTQRPASAHHAFQCQWNDHEDVTFHVPGRFEADLLDPGCFTLSIDIQSAATLYSEVMFRFTFTPPHHGKVN
jgi:hypothetical protein